MFVYRRRTSALLPLISLPSWFFMAGGYDGALLHVQHCWNHVVWKVLRICKLLRNLYECNEFHRLHRENSVALGFSFVSNYSAANACQTENTHNWAHRKCNLRLIWSWALDEAFINFRTRSQFQLRMHLVYGVRGTFEQFKPIEMFLNGERHFSCKFWVPTAATRFTTACCCFNASRHFSDQIASFVNGK